MHRNFIYLMASIVLFAFASTSNAYSQSNISQPDLAEALTNDAADVQDAQETQKTMESSKVNIPGPPLEMPFPAAPPPNMGKTAFCGFFINDAPAATTFSVKDAEGRKLIIKGSNNQYLPQPPDSVYIYNISVSGNETNAYLIALEEETPMSAPLDLIIESDSGQCYLLKVKN